MGSSSLSSKRKGGVHSPCTCSEGTSWQWRPSLVTDGPRAGLQESPACSSEAFFPPHPELFPAAPPRSPECGGHWTQWCGGRFRAGGSDEPPGCLSCTHNCCVTWGRRCDKPAFAHPSNSSACEGCT